MKTCPECKKEISSSAGKCPNCGRKFTTLAGCVGGILFGLLLAGLFISWVTRNGGLPRHGDTGMFSQPTAQPRQAYDPATETWRIEAEKTRMAIRTSVLDQNLDYDYQSKDYHFVGRVTNNTDEILRWVSVEYSIYDADEAKIGRAVDSIIDLRPHEVWKFKARIFEKEFKKYRFEGVTAR